MAPLKYKVFLKFLLDDILLKILRENITPGGIEQKMTLSFCVSILKICF